MTAWRWRRLDAADAGGKLATGVLVGTACALLGVLLFISPWGRVIEQGWGLNWLFQLRGPVPAPPHVVIVSLDRGSSERLGVRHRPDHWPRRLHAALIRRLHAAGAQAIVFDLWFDRPGPLADDAAFARAIGEAGNVLLLERLAKTTLSGRGASELALHQLHPPHPRFAYHALASGPFTLPKIPVAVSHFWTFDKAAGDTPSLASLALFAAYPDAHDVVLTDCYRGVEQRAPPDNLRGTVQSTFANRQRTCGLASDTSATARVTTAPSPDPMVGRLRDIYTGPQSRVLNLYGPPRSIPTIPYWKILTPDADATAQATAAPIAGSIVLVGMSSRSQPDQADAFVTPYSDPVSGHDIAGVELLATAVANLADGRSIALPAPGWQIAAVLLFGFAVGMVCGGLPPMLAVLATLLVGGGWLAIAMMGFTEHYLWLPLAVPLAGQIPMALVMGLGVQAVASRSIQRRMGAAVSRYLPTHVVRRMGRKDFHPAHERQAVYGVCLSTDAERFTDFAEALPPDELARQVNRYYAALFAPVTRHGGHVSDVVGDAMLALWTGPMPSLTLRRSACLAVRDILQGDPEPQVPALLRTRMGLHAGELVLSHVGAGDHFEYRAVGDTVNTAARLQALNKPLGTCCLASSDAMAGLPDVPARRLGRFALKGKRRPVTVYALCHAPDADFDRALSALERHAWQAAYAGFSRLAAANPADGPARFFASLCADYRASPPAADWPGVIAVAPD